MKYLRAALIGLTVFGIIVFLSGVSSAEDEPIGQLFKDKKSVKVYVREAVNESGQAQISTEAFKQSLEQGLLNRKSIKFEITDTPEESDIQISSVIKEYRYLEKGPLKFKPGLSIIVDAMATVTENYADISVQFTVSDTKSNETLWDDTLSGYVKKTMTAEESVPLIYNKISGTFIWKCFGRRNVPALQ